jgi:hypothetical protein
LNPGNLLVSNKTATFRRYQIVTKARQRMPTKWGSLRLSFLLSLALADPEQSAKGLQMDTMENTWDKFQKQLQTEEESFDYEGTISFTTNQKLTQDQLNQLMDIIALQIIEPVDADQEDEDYSTRGVEVTVKEVE